MATFTWTGAGNTDWTEPTNWQVGGAATAIAPNDPTADAVATINGPDGFEFPIISGGAAITLNSLTAAGTAHVIVGGGQLGGTGTGSLNALGSISVTSTDAGGGLVGALGSTITTPSLTVGAGAAVGGGGTYIVTSLVNSGIIQGDGANFGLGTLTVTGGTITGPGSIEVDGPSTFELGSATAETITVVAAPTETATVIFDNPGSFTGSLNLLNADTHLNLFFQGQTPTGATFDGKSLIVTGATGTIDVIPMIAVGPVVLGTSGSGEVSINSLQPSALTLERDFDGDGHSDILWQNDHGSAAIWLMNAAGTAQITGTILDSPGTDWHVKGSGDFNGDGHADVLWQNDNGSVATWLMDAAGTTPIAAPLIGTNPGPAWHVKGTGDFNGDGQPTSSGRTTTAASRSG